MLMTELQDVGHILLRPFNVTPGVAFVTPDPDNVSMVAVWIAMQVERFSDTERVWIWARRGDMIAEGPNDQIPTRTFNLDFNDSIPVVGICVNPADPDDNDWGNI